MLGKASEIKTLLVEEKKDPEHFNELLNKELYLLQDSTVIEIKFTATPDSDGVAWFNALIIYKEGESS